MFSFESLKLMTLQLNILTIFQYFRFKDPKLSQTENFFSKKKNYKSSSLKKNLNFPDPTQEENLSKIPRIKKTSFLEANILIVPSGPIQLRQK